MPASGFDGAFAAYGRSPRIRELFGATSLDHTLAGVGFTELQVSEHPAWEVRRRRVYEAALAIDPAGDPGLISLREEAEHALPLMPQQRRLLIFATRP